MNTHVVRVIWQGVLHVSDEGTFGPMPEKTADEMLKKLNKQKNWTAWKEPVE